MIEKIYLKDEEIDNGEQQGNLLLLNGKKYKIVEGDSEGAYVVEVKE
jgi:hypothetical protein